MAYGTYGDDFFMSNDLGVFGYPEVGNRTQFAGNDNLFGGAGDNIIEGATGNDRLYGQGGDDILKGGGGADELDGGSGIDVAGYDYAQGPVTVSLATGTGSRGDAQGDTYYDIENVAGSGFDDGITGNAGANFLRGNGGDDQLKGGGGADALWGDAGTDTVSYFTSPAGVTVNLVTGAGAGGDAQGDTFREVENVTGSQHDDVITAGAGANALAGGDGNDLLTGGAGADALNGGNGNDTAGYATALAGVRASLSAPGTNTGDALGDTYAGIENLTGSAFADVLIGDGGANRLTGGAGDDQLVGGAGADTMVGGLGDDYSYVDNAGDVVIEGVNEGLDRVFSSVSYALSANVEALFLQGGAVSGTGNAGDNTIIGTTGSNALYGLGGSDYLVDGGGADTMVGGAGDDYYFVSSAGGTITEVPGEGFDRIFSTVGLVMADNTEALILQGGAMVGIGNAGNNGIVGNAQDNVLSGGAGNDVLYGFGGNDTFVFRSQYGADIVGDFEGAGVPGGDVLQIDPGFAADFAALQAFRAQDGPNAVFTFAFGTTLTLLNVNGAGLTAGDVVFA